MKAQKRKKNIKPLMAWVSDREGVVRVFIDRKRSANFGKPVAAIKLGLAIYSNAERREIEALLERVWVEATHETEERMERGGKLLLPLCEDCRNLHLPRGFRRVDPGQSVFSRDNPPLVTDMG